MHLMLRLMMLAGSCHAHALFGNWSLEAAWPVQEWASDAHDARKNNKGPWPLGSL